MGGLILEQELSNKMEETAERKGDLMYIWKKDLSPNQFIPKLQILTAQEIIDGQLFDLSPTMMQIRKYRKEKLCSKAFSL